MMSYSFDITNPNYEKYVKLLFDSTHGDSLTLFGWEYDTASEEYLYHCKINWSQEDIPKFINEFNAHCDMIKSIANKDKGKLNKNIKKTKDFLEKYLKQFAAFSDEKFVELYNKEPDKLSEEEKIYYLNKQSEIYMEAQNRLSNKFAYDVIIASMRLCRLIEIGAHRFIVANQKRILLEAMLIARYCTAKETVFYDDLPVEDLEYLAKSFCSYFFYMDSYNIDNDVALDFAFRAIKKGSKKCFGVVAKILSQIYDNRSPNYKEAAKYFDLALEEGEEDLLGQYMLLERASSFFWSLEKGNDVKKAKKYRDLLEKFKNDTPGFNNKSMM